MVLSVFVAGYKTFPVCREVLMALWVIFLESQNIYFNSNPEKNRTVRVTVSDLSRKFSCLSKVT